MTRLLSSAGNGAEINEYTLCLREGRIADYYSAAQRLRDEFSAAPNGVKDR